MGILESLNSTAEAVRKGLPDPTPAKDIAVSAAKSVSAAAGTVGGAATNLGAVCRSAADYGWGTASWIDRTVRLDGARRIHEAMPDRDGWERIGRTAWRIGDHTIAEASRPYTGGIPVYRYLREEWSKDGGVPSPPPPVKDKAVEEELQALRKRVEMMEALVMEKASEDVIKEFVTKGLKLNVGGFAYKIKTNPQQMKYATTTPSIAELGIISVVSDE